MLINPNSDPTGSCFFPCLLHFFHPSASSSCLCCFRCFCDILSKATISFRFSMTSFVFFSLFFFSFFSQISVESPILFHPSRSILSSSYGICFCFVFLAQVPTVSQSSLGQFLTFPCRVGGQGPHSLAHQKNRISFLIRSLAPRIFGKLLLTLIVGSLL